MTNPNLKKTSDVNDSEDPFLWLEDVTGDRALTWVREQNAKAEGWLTGSSGFQQLNQELLGILNSDDRIPYVEKHGEFYYNFWRDASHEKGIWRRTTLEEYRKSSPNWETLLDLDQLSKEEGESWVWDGATFLEPTNDLVLIDLSRGGADATVTREFDVNAKSFVMNGFARAEAKGGMQWIDRNQVFVYTDFGAGSMTDSGYPRIVKRLERGESLDRARIVYEGNSQDMYIAAYHDTSPGFERDFVSRTIAFYNNEVFLIDGDQLVKIDAPNSAEKRVFHANLYLHLREPWSIGGREFQAGSLLVADFKAFLSGNRDFNLLFEPTERSSLESFVPTKEAVYLNVLEDVKNRIYVARSKANGEWEQQPLVGAPEFGTIQISAVDADESSQYWMTSSDYITPTTLYLGDAGSPPERLKQLKPLFDAEGLSIEQHFANSKDGTAVPYFVVGPKNMKLDSSHPTLLYGYGGFEISLTPGYNPSVGKAWLELGGVYVVANIRGGGEYGPRWHQAALKANRPRAYEDFAAVAENLVRRGVTKVEHLGIEGRSNGGLLVGNMFTKYPNLFSAAVCGVPLLDMKRYHLLLAGASWMAEYGNPDAAGEWDFIQTYSPYQNVHSDVKYPSILFTTSTRDDRVHPGHARKMMARMDSQGHEVHYYENIEGGHGGAANNTQRAYVQALTFTFLKSKLFDPK